MKNPLSEEIERLKNKEGCWGILGWLRYHFEEGWRLSWKGSPRPFGIYQNEPIWNDSLGKWKLETVARLSTLSSLVTSFCFIFLLKQHALKILNKLLGDKGWFFGVMELDSRFQPYDPKGF